MNEELKNELADTVCEACERVWDQIGMDCLPLCGGEASAAEVVELCVDADRLVMFEEHDAEAAWELLYKEIEEFHGSAGYAKQLAFVSSRMKFEIYGY